MELPWAKRPINGAVSFWEPFSTGLGTQQGFNKCSFKNNKCYSSPSTHGTFCVLPSPTRAGICVYHHCSVLGTQYGLSVCQRSGCVDRLGTQPPRDDTTQAAHKKSFKLKKVRSISAQTGTEGPAPHALWSPPVGGGTDSQKGT